jgi:hypothetical protein
MEIFLEFSLFFRRSDEGTGNGGAGRGGLEKFEGGVVFFPEVLGGVIGGFDEGNDPAIETPAFIRDKGDGSTTGGKEENKRPLDVKGEGEGVGDEGEDDATGEPAELFKGHVADEAEFIGGNLGGDGVLFERHGSKIKN